MISRAPAALRHPCRPAAARARGHGVPVCRARAPVTALHRFVCRARAPVMAPPSAARASRISSPILVTSWAPGCYVHPGCFVATCYAILSPLLPARMSPGMQLTAEVPAWLSSVSRIVVRYANKNVILGNTVVTKHEHWGRTWPHFTASALALTPRRRKGNVRGERVAAEHLSGHQTFPGAGTGFGPAADVRSPRCSTTSQGDR